MNRSNELLEAAEIIRDAEEIVMACHVGPDGDALGAMLGMAVAARANGVRVFASFGEPFTFPDSYRFLPLDVLVPPGDIPTEPDVMITFDAGSIDRLGSLAETASMAGTLIVVDHHVSNNGFGHVNVIEPDAAATAEVVYALLDELGWKLDATIASCLLTGLVTDTGRFQYSNTGVGTLEVAARLVEAGAQPEMIGRHVYEESPFGYLGVAARVLGRAQLDIPRRLVHSTLFRADLAELGVGMDDIDGLIDDLRIARESDVALLVKETDDGVAKGSLRSRGRVDVGMIASELGGGGHHNAAGFTFQGTPEDAVAAVVARLEPVDD